MQRAGQRMPLATFANTAAGHKKFIRWATKSVHPARVCLEATGIYSLQFALAVHDARNVEVMVVNPRAIKDFARACMQRAKTDAVDAAGILEYLERMPFTAWQPPAPEILQLQAINRRIVQLQTELTREKNRCHAARPGFRRQQILRARRKNCLTGKRVSNDQGNRRAAPMLARKKECAGASG